MSLQALFPNTPCPDKRFDWYYLEEMFLEERDKDIPINIDTITEEFLNKQKKHTKDFLKKMYHHSENPASEDKKEKLNDNEEEELSDNNEEELSDNNKEELIDEGELIKYCISTNKRLNYPYVVVEEIYIRPCALGKGLFDKFINNIVQAIIEEDLMLGIKLEDTGFYLNAYGIKYSLVWRREQGVFTNNWLCDYNTMIKYKTWFQERATQKKIPTYNELSNTEEAQFESDCDVFFEFFNNVIIPALEILKQRELIRNQKKLNGTYFQNFDTKLKQLLEFSKKNNKTCYSLHKIMQFNDIYDKKKHEINNSLVREIKNELCC